VILLSAGLTFATPPYQGTGIKIGEVGTSSTVVWTRLTTVPRGDANSPTAAAPGASGETRVTWWPTANSNTTTSTTWEAADPVRDYTRHFTLTNLSPDTAYNLRVESRPTGGGATTSVLTGRFKTAPEQSTKARVLATIVTCQGIGSVDSGTNGHRVYQEMAAISPDFFVHTGDVLYYDKDYGGLQPLSQSVVQARQRWNRMFSYGYNQAFPQGVACYFMKDDHDTLKDDCYPGQTYGSLTFQQGLDLFKEQTPMGPLPYRTFRWGKDLQIWLLEGRDYRSANTAPDGPAKTILGPAQKSWLTNGVRASDATFKLIISPGPMVGPDKAGKADNHSNPAFQTEGNELRRFIAAERNVLVICGDRHWQYASIDPVTGVREYGCGPINAEHNYGGNPGYKPDYHTFFDPGGGYLSALVEREDGLPQITFRWHNANNLDPQTGLFRINYEETLREAGFGRITITRNHLTGQVNLKCMTVNGFVYTVQQSADLQAWTNATAAIDTRGTLLIYRDSNPSASESRRYYRVLQEPRPVSNFLAPHSTGVNGGTYAADKFNRANFVLDLLFATPVDLNSGTDLLLWETGGSTRGTIIGIDDGRLVLSAGVQGGSIVSYRAPTLLEPDTAYSLRIIAVAENADGADSFRADLWRAGDPAPVTILNEMGLTVDGFSGTDGVGVGRVNGATFTSGLAVPTNNAPAGMPVSFAAYDQDLATSAFPLPPQARP